MTALQRTHHINPLPQCVNGVHAQNAAGLEDGKQPRCINEAVGRCQKNPCGVDTRQQTVEENKEAIEHKRHLIAGTHTCTNESTVVINSGNTAPTTWFWAVLRTKGASNVAGLALLPVTRCAAVVHVSSDGARVLQRRNEVENCM